jgi:xylulose-5-phosphate/fructose-6-phosphate phosphoketolase
MPDSLSPDLLRKMHAYWRAANYLSVGQIYLQDNPLLESPLRLEHIKPRLLGHWGTTPGLNFLYVHLNRLIKENDLNMMYVIGPGHGGPGLVAQTYLEGSYTERYPAIERSRNGLHRLFRQFSWPYGIPSHVAPETPGSIHRLRGNNAQVWRAICSSSCEARTRTGQRDAGSLMGLFADRFRARRA